MTEKTPECCSDKRDQQMSKTKKLTFITICRWLPQNKKSPPFFFLNEKGIFYTSLSRGIKNKRCYYQLIEVQLLVCDGETLTVILIATNACRTFGATKLTYCLVVYAVQLFSS